MDDDFDRQFFRWHGYDPAEGLDLDDPSDRAEAEYRRRRYLGTIGQIPSGLKMKDWLELNP